VLWNLSKILKLNPEQINYWEVFLYELIGDMLGTYMFWIKGFVKNFIGLLKNCLLFLFFCLSRLA